MCSGDIENKKRVLTLKYFTTHSEVGLIDENGF